MHQVSLLLAAVLLLAGSYSTPVFAGKCYGLDPCYACRNCSACMHCSQMGGKCGVCGGGKDASNPRVPRTTTRSDLPATTFSPSRYTLRKPVIPNDALDQTIAPPAAPQFERSDVIGRDSSDGTENSSGLSNVSPIILDLNQFPFNPYTGLPNPNYRGKRIRGGSNLRQDSDFADSGQGSVRSGVQSGQVVPLDESVAPYEHPYPYGQSPQMGMPVQGLPYPITPGFSGASGSGYSSGSFGTQHVNGYFRKDGTYVHPYTRRSRSR